MDTAIRPLHRSSSSAKDLPSGVAAGREFDEPKEAIFTHRTRRAKAKETNFSPKDGPKPRLKANEARLEQACPGRRLVPIIRSAKKKTEISPDRHIEYRDVENRIV
jgi:hypothetical protein